MNVGTLPVFFYNTYQNDPSFTYLKFDPGTADFGVLTIDEISPMEIPSVIPAQIAPDECHHKYN